MKRKSKHQPTAEATSEEELLTHAFLTIEETAVLLRTNSRQVRRMIYSGKLNATRLSYHCTIIKKENILMMIEQSNYRKQEASIFAKPKKKTAKQKAEPKTEALPQRKGKEEGNTDAKAQTAPKRQTVSRQRQLIPSSQYKQSVKDTFTDSQYSDSQLYTMAEICRKYKYTYGRFYNLRMRYNIPCVKANKTKCFPKAEVDKAMADEAERLGREQSEHWYSCADIMRIYGLGKTQVRRFAEAHKVRIKKCGKDNRYMKADWEAARKEAERCSASTKPKREY